MNSMARACSMVVNLLFPRGCAGCDKPDEVLCEACRALFSQPTAQSFDGVAMQRWFACGWYRGTVRRAVLAWKDHGDEECDRAFADATRSAQAVSRRDGLDSFLSRRHDEAGYGSRDGDAGRPRARRWARREGRRARLRDARTSLSGAVGTCAEGMAHGAVLAAAPRSRERLDAHGASGR